MKIGLITDLIRKDLTGVGYYAKNLADLLIKNDKTNKYFFIDYKRNSFNEKNLIFIKNCFKFFFKTYLWHNILPFVTKKLDLDIIFNLSCCPHYFPLKQKEVIFVYDLSLLITPQFHSKSGVIFFKTLIKRTLNNSHKIIAISENTKKDLMKYYKIPADKIVVIYPTLPKQAKSQKKPKIAIKKPYLLYLGTLEPRKNIPSIIKAFSQLKAASFFPYQLIVAGKKGWGYSGIFRLVKKLHLENEVMFTDYVSEEEKKYLYKHASLFVYPSFYEGFGIPPLEAMAYGCPVITSNTSSLPEVVGDAGLMVNPYNVDELVLTIKKILNDKKLKTDMIKKGFVQARKFYRQQNINIITSVYI